MFNGFVNPPSLRGIPIRENKCSRAMFLDEVKPSDKFFCTGFKTTPIKDIQDMTARALTISHGL